MRVAFELAGGVPVIALIVALAVVYLLGSVMAMFATKAGQSARGAAWLGLAVCWPLAVLLGLVRAVFAIVDFERRRAADLQVTITADTRRFDEQLRRAAERTERRRP